MNLIKREEKILLKKGLIIRDGDSNIFIGIKNIFKPYIYIPHDFVLLNH